MQTPAVCGVAKPNSRPAPVCRVLHPLGKALAVGQLVVVQVPQNLGQPARLHFDQENTTAGMGVASAVLNPVPATDTEAKSTYVACWDSDCAQPLLKVTAAQLQLTIGSEVKEVRSSQEQAQPSSWTSCG